MGEKPELRAESFSVARRAYHLSILMRIEIEEWKKDEEERSYFVFNSMVSYISKYETVLWCWVGYATFRAI